MIPPDVDLFVLFAASQVCIHVYVDIVGQLAIVELPTELGYSDKIRCKALEGNHRFVSRPRGLSA